MGADSAAPVPTLSPADGIPDYFASREQARWQTWLLILFFVAAVVVTVALGMGAGAVLWLLFSSRRAGIDVRYLASDDGHFMMRFDLVPNWVWIVWAAVVLGIILLSALIENANSRDGGMLARQAGGRLVTRESTSPAELRLLEVVEEVALAVGIPVPEVYFIFDDSGVNAFAAGFEHDRAAVAVTKGALKRLRRDELQALVAHEIAHIVRGHAALNTRLIGILAGIQFIGASGVTLIRMAPRLQGGSRGIFEARAIMIVLGILSAIAGYFGLFLGRLAKAAVSRMREYQADADAVRITGNPRALCGVFALLAKTPEISTVGLCAEKLSHMFFAPGAPIWPRRLVASHPDHRRRWARIDPAFDPEAYLEQRRPELLPQAVPRPSGPRDLASWTAEFADDEPYDGIGSRVAPQLMVARRLLSQVPEEIAAALATTQGARQLALSLVGAGPLADAVARLGTAWRMPLFELALPQLRQLPADERKALTAECERRMAADGRLNLTELALMLCLRHGLADEHRLRPPGGERLAALAEDCRIVLALVAHAGGGRAELNYLKACRTVGITGGDLPGAAALGPTAAVAALERLGRLMPLDAALLVRACLVAAIADDVLRVAEAEMIRAVCAALGCPLPPVIAGISPARLQA